MDRMVAGILLLSALAFASGWTVAGWQRDSIDLTIRNTAAATGKDLANISSSSGRRLEEKLEAIREAPPREIRTEVVKPVFTNVCMSDDFVRMYNEAAAGTERALSGKSAD
ncbi:hypothetical protein EXB42_19185 [Salmonella enterica subsp. enterica serovar Agona]|uniref:Uncharacterized protein n=2 Tax=Salmonella enterica I TaxID=59201 RepID=A0A5U8VJ26_SALET|nr:hypothetical protein [Salmonella enterica subsp. enterica serovar Agona]EHQ4607381.1 hypothetical protein [Salmonella enterica]EAB9346041.1 hypothetical protein [Salmonella enterica subsp. enterica serovar Agona]EBG5973688.1 hypothetical protein [Salmonella enterica subsp. enterica serovar Agona]EBR0411090.1 hypothetical protein [Salmonella enterica subsp. enterica serovar Agona]